MTWTFSQLEVYLPREVWETSYTHLIASGMMIGAGFIALLYPVTHTVLFSNSKVYRELLSHDQQTVVVTHAIEAVVLSLLFLPLTYLVLSMHFEVQSLDLWQSKSAAALTMMFVIIIMYLIELAVRYRKPRALVVLHHLCAYANTLLPSIEPTTTNMKAASLLVYFVTFEALTFVGLVMYRLCPEHRATRRVILTAMYIFGLTRPFQLAWILTSLALVWDDVVMWQAVVQILLSVFFVTIQFYSLTIHYGMYKRIAGKAAPKEMEGEHDDVCPMMQHRV